METSERHDNYMSIICHDIERSIVWIYIGACAFPFLILGLIYIKFSLGHPGKEFSPADLKLSVVFLFIAGVFALLSFRIKGYQYRLLIDKKNGRFNYQKDNLFGVNQINGEVQKIDEIYVREASAFYDKISTLRRTIYQIIMRFSHQDIIIYVSPHRDEAHSMASSLSGFLGVPLGQEED